MIFKKLFINSRDLAIVIAVAVLSCLAVAYATLQAGMSFDQYDQKIVKEAVVTDVHDGDTITVEMTYSINVRLIDCWAPEIKGKEKELGVKSKDHLNSLVKKGDKVLVEVPLTNHLSSSLSLGRVLARVYKDVDGDGKNDDLSTVMVNDGFATKNKSQKK